MVHVILFVSDAHSYVVVALASEWFCTVSLRCADGYWLTAVIYYDYLLILSREIKLVWLGKMSFATAMFLFNRHLALAWAAVQAAFALHVWSNNTVRFSLGYPSFTQLFMTSASRGASIVHCEKLILSTSDSGYLKLYRRVFKLVYYS